MPDTTPVPRRADRSIAVVGVTATRDLSPGGGSTARLRLPSEADLVVGARRHLDAAAGLLHARARAVCIGHTGISLDEALDLIDSEPGRTCVLASGDPGFFGIVRVLAQRFGSAALDVHPAPTSVSYAFARLGLPWDDSIVVSAHGRPMAESCALAARHGKVAVLTDPSVPSSALATALLAAGAAHEHAAVAASLGDLAESVVLTTLSALASAGPDPLPDPSVLLLWSGDGVSPAPSRCFPAPSLRVEWGLPASSYQPRHGMVTKPEVRAAVLSRLALCPAGVLWDIGAGSGSVGIEAARIFPGLTVVAFDRDADACATVSSNAALHGVSVEVVCGEVPAVLPSGANPHSVFVGGGGVDVLSCVVERVGPVSRIVATFAALDRAVEAHRMLGNLVEVSVSRAATLPDGGVRLSAENPVFVAWGGAGAGTAK